MSTSVTCPTCKSPVNPRTNECACEDETDDIFRHEWLVIVADPYDAAFADYATEAEAREAFAVAVEEEAAVTWRRVPVPVLLVRTIESYTGPAGDREQSD